KGPRADREGRWLRPFHGAAGDDVRHARVDPRREFRRGIPRDPAGARGAGPGPRAEDNVPRRAHQGLPQRSLGGMDIMSEGDLLQAGLRGSPQQSQQNAAAIAAGSGYFERLGEAELRKAEAQQAAAQAQLDFLKKAASTLGQKAK